MQSAVNPRKTLHCNNVDIQLSEQGQKKMRGHAILSSPRQTCLVIMSKSRLHVFSQQHEKAEAFLWSMAAVQNK